MVEQTYPITCKSCGRQLYGPVTYCPYCAARSAVTLASKTVVQSAIIKQTADETVVKPRPESVSVQQMPPTQTEAPFEKIQNISKRSEQKSEPILEIKTEHAKDQPVQVVPKPMPNNFKWIAVAVILVVGIVGYLVYHKKGVSSQDPPVSKQSSAPTTQALGKKESARIAALDALRLGTSLSLAISKLPKLNVVLKAAKQLGDISPRYQEQIASAENMISSAKTDRDKSLMAYIGKVIELGLYKPDQVSYAIDVIQSGDVSPREKIVIELLAKHVNSSRNSSKADAKKMLSDFNQRFKDFVD